MSLVPPIVSPLLPGALYGVNDPANGPNSGYYCSCITDIVVGIPYMWKSHLLICFVIHSDTGMKVERSMIQASVTTRWASPDLVKEAQALAKI